VSAATLAAATEASVLAAAAVTDAGIGAVIAAMMLGADGSGCGPTQEQPGARQGTVGTAASHRWPLEHR
jgi:hypothetical protein